MELLFLLLAGNLLVYLILDLPASKSLSVKWLNNWFIDLFHCPLCLGCYIFFSLCAFFRFEITSWVGIGYVPLVSEAISAAMMSWVSFIFFLGLKFRYGEFLVE